MQIEPRPIKHWVHILLTILTAGFWLIIYIPMIFIRKNAQNSFYQNQEISTETNEPNISLNFIVPDNSYEDWKDERKAECPYCFSILKKIPGAKTRCPSCGFSMYVRFDPRTKSQRVVKEEELEEIDDERAKLNGTWEVRLAEKNRKIQVREDLRKSFGTEPGENDIKWRIYNEDLIFHAGEGAWGLYRNTLHEMGKLLKKEGKLKNALSFYLDVVYIDACGPSNGKTWGDPIDIMYLPYFAEEITKIAIKLEMTEEQVLDLYKERSGVLKESLKLKKDFITCWKKFKIETNFALN